MQKKEELHKEHKKRLRSRFLNDCDFQGFSEHEILELLLNYSVVRGNTNDTAHRLLETFGNISNVFDASPEELMSVEGVGERSAALIKMQHSLFRVYMQSKYRVHGKLYSEEALKLRLKGFYFGKKQEYLYMLCLDSKNVIIKESIISKGLTSAKADMREIYRIVLSLNARSVIFAHNHPNGVLKPSDEDLKCTRFLMEQLLLVGVQVIDHFIVADNDCLSVMDTHSFRFVSVEDLM